MTQAGRKSYIAIIGATASGKSALAMRLAAASGGELVNCDSVQLYRGFSIGAAKPSAEDQKAVPHHLWDIADWSEDFDARLYADAADAAIAEIHGRGKLPIVVGGTGLYLRAMWRDAWHDLPKDEGLRAELEKLSTEELRLRLEALDPARAAEIHANDRFRLERAVEVATLLGHSVKDLSAPASRREEACVIRVECLRSVLHQRIALRTQEMLQSGLIEEVKSLLDAGVAPDCKAMQSIGYHEVVKYLQGQLDFRDLETAIVIATRQYAKRQDTWFRKIKVDLSWESEGDFPALLAEINRFFPK